MGHLTECRKKLASQRYSNKNWSCAFECPTCGKIERRNTNFLGQRTLFCDGKKFSTVKTFADFRALNEKFKAEGAK